MTDHVFDLTVLLEGGTAGGRAGSGIRMAWNSTEHGALLRLKPWAKKEERKRRQTSAAPSQSLPNTQTQTHTCNGPTQECRQANTLRLPYNNRCLYNTEIKSWVHPAIRASQTQFPSDVWPPHIPRLFRVNDWGQYHHINIILCSLTPLLPPFSQ